MDWYSEKTPMVIGHRGASGYAPENTLAAFQLAADQGAVGIEFDVRLSADGWPVVIHDGMIDRTTNGSGAVAEMTLQELQSFDAGNGQRIPTLDEVFELLGRSFLYNVEIKVYGWRDQGVEAAVADRIQAFSLEDQVAVSTFSPAGVHRARRYMNRRTPVALIRAPGIAKYTHLFAGGQADHPHYSLVNERYMAWAKRRNYRVHVWTVDDPVEAQRLARLGVHAVMTNKPDVIRDSLAELAAG